MALLGYDILYPRGPGPREGAIAMNQMNWSDDRVEQYRAVFIPVGVKPNSLTHFAFGAFNSRVIERPIAA